MEVLDPDLDLEVKSDYANSDTGETEKSDFEVKSISKNHARESIEIYQRQAGLIESFAVFLDLDADEDRKARQSVFTF